MKSFASLEVTAIERQTAEAVAVTFKVPESERESFVYKQGQHVTLRKEIDGEELRRCYSICAAVDENTLRIAVKEIKDGRFSGYINRKLKVGDTLDVYPPAGHFNTDLSSSNAKTYLCVAGGSGITPILSIIKTTLREEPKSQCILLYGNRNTASMIFAEELFALKNVYMERFQIFHVLEDDLQEVELFNGLLTKERCIEFFSGVIKLTNIDEVFICGPGPMMDNAEAALIECKFDQNHIHIERFISGPDTLPASERVTSSHIEADAWIDVQINGVKTGFPFDPEKFSILDNALAKGIDVPFACKGAVCCTCRAKVLEGEVDMKLNYGLEDDELAAGYVLTCQAQPLSKKVVISYDE